MKAGCVIERRDKLTTTGNGSDRGAHDGAANGRAASAEITARLHRLIGSATGSIDGAASASLTIDADRLHVLIESDDAMAPLQAAERAEDDGPGLSARRSGEVIRISSTVDDGPWEVFREACRSVGIMSTASFAISLDGERVGALTVHSPDYHAFDVDAIRAGRQIAIEIAEAIDAAPDSPDTPDSPADG